MTLALGDGLAAVVTVTRMAIDRGRTRAFLKYVGEYQRPSGENLYLRVSARIDNVQYGVPAAVVILAGRERVEVRFTASPLLHGAAALGSAGCAALAAAARRASDWDDDD